MNIIRDAQIFSNDIPDLFMDEIKDENSVSWDIETTGLNWNSDRIATCQLYFPCIDKILIIKISSILPRNLIAVLNAKEIQKIFHHAMFDLRFMSYYWKCHAENICCTKIASKLLYPQQKENHNLKSLVLNHLGIVLDKSLSCSDWTAQQLTIEQIKYATSDVLYLHKLLNKLEIQLMNNNLLDLAKSCFAHIPTRVELELGNYGDVFTY